MTRMRSALKSEGAFGILMRKMVTLSRNSDWHGSADPRRFGCGFAGVRVRVQYLNPCQTRTPGDGYTGWGKGNF